MRVQFNLLPEVKQKYIEAQHTKRTISAIAVAVTAGCVALFLLMLSIVYGVNKLQLSSADNSIKKYQQQLSNIPNIGKILTVQNQLNALVGLHQSKHLTSRIFPYLTELTPTNVKIGQVQMDLTADTMELDGTADDQKAINTFIDTLKFTTYKLNNQETHKNAFTSVVESSFGVDPKGASYTLNIQFDPALFQNSDNVSLTVPALATTRSVLDDPTNVLFNGQTGSTNKTNSNSSNGSTGGP